MYEEYIVDGFYTQYSMPIDFFNGYPLITESLRTTLVVELEFVELPTQQFWLQLELSNVDLQQKLYSFNSISLPNVNYINGAIDMRPF
jgi:hypothetical protein